MNNAITEIKSTLEGTNSRITEAEYRMVEINEAERKKEKRIKRNEDNLRDLQVKVKHPKIQIIGVQEEEEKRKAMKKYLRR